MTEEELASIRQRCENATSGPWISYIEGRDHTSGSNFIITGSGEDIALTGATNADQDFIANARQDIPRLLAEIARLRRTPVKRKCLNRIARNQQRKKQCSISISFLAGLQIKLPDTTLNNKNDIRTRDFKIPRRLDIRRPEFFAS